MRVVMCQNISGGTEKGAEKVGRGSGFHTICLIYIIESFCEWTNIVSNYISL